MKTEQIRLIQDTYTVPAEVGGYLVTCPGCGARINLYDMYHGFCPWCESSMKKILGGNEEKSLAFSYFFVDW